MTGATGVTKSGISGSGFGSDGLSHLTLAYLTLPNLIFLLGWYRLPVALLAIAALAWAAIHVGGGSLQWRTGHSRTALAIIAIAALIWAAFGGASHFLHAQDDWIVRDALLGDLINADWPVAYSAPDDTPLLLRSAIGYFLPPALFGKAFGLEYLAMFTFLWTAAGLLLFLALLPLPQRAGRTLVLALLVTVFFSGMDILGILVAQQISPIFPLRLEWWGPLSYSSLTGQFLWAPNHCLPIWLGTAMLVRHIGAPNFLRLAILLLPLTFVWTPFAALGLMPFVILGGVRELRARSLSALPMGPLAGVAVFSLPILAVLLLGLGGIDTGATMERAPGPPANDAYRVVSWRDYLNFVCFEFLVFALALVPYLRRDRNLFWVAVAILMLLPFIHLGPSNDALLRLSIPPLVILLIIFLKDGLGAGLPCKKPSLLLAWLCLIIGATTPFYELWRTATFNRWKPDYSVTLAERQGGFPAAHYAARLDSNLLRVLLRPVRIMKSRQNTAQ